MKTQLSIGSENGTGRAPARLHDERFAAAYTGLSLSTLRRMRQRRTRGESGAEAGPNFVRIFSAVRYDQRDLDAFCDALPRAGGGGAQ